MGTLILGIYAHFLNNMYILIHPLLTLHFLVGHYTKPIMVEVIKVVMHKFRIADKWGVYVVDNADNNDIYIAALVRSL